MLPNRSLGLFLLAAYLGCGCTPTDDAKVPVAAGDPAEPAEGREYREHPGPRYFHDRHQLESILADLKAWLPGGWSSFPHVYYDRHVTAPIDDEHEDWYRTFALIDAPQVGETVFYGQINVGGPEGPILGRTQVLYKTWIDDERGMVVINGQTVADPERYADLHDKPELWGEVQMRDESAIRCDFVWYRNGTQIVGVLEGKTEESRRYGPRTCSYHSPTADAQFFADAEWVLGPDELWLYDINTMDGFLFIGRHDRSHLKLYRTSDYRCVVTGVNGDRSIVAHDRGFRVELPDEQHLLLLRAPYPSDDGGLVDELRLMLRTDSNDIVALARSGPGASVQLDGERVAASCTPLVET